MTVNDADQDLGPLTSASRAVACSVQSGRDLVGTRDLFVRAQSPFDRQSRLQIDPTAMTVTVDGYLSFVKNQVLPFTAPEVQALTQVVASIKGQFESGKLNLSLPPTVRFVKTSGLEEGDAAYTRNQDTVVFPVSKLTPSGGGDALHPEDIAAVIEPIAIHELFHIQSKNAPATRERVYRTIGFEVLGKPVELPNVPHPGGGTWPEYKITNPDAPVLDVKIDLSLDSQPNGPSRPMTPVLLANGPYTGGAFFDYLIWGFLVLEPDGSGGYRVAIGPDGQPFFVPHDDVQRTYRQKIGRNFTHEIFHPDEVLAQSFVLVVTEPDMGLLQKLGAELRRRSA